MNPVNAPEPTGQTPPVSVSVVSRTPHNLRLRVSATAITTAGLWVSFLVISQPQLTQMFPRAIWLGPAITALGKSWELYQNWYDKHRVEEVAPYVPETKA